MNFLTQAHGGMAEPLLAQRFFGLAPYANRSRELSFDDVDGDSVHDDLDLGVVISQGLDTAGGAMLQRLYQEDAQDNAFDIQRGNLYLGDSVVANKLFSEDSFVSSGNRMGRCIAQATSRLQAEWCMLKKPFICSAPNPFIRGKPASPQNHMQAGVTLDEKAELVDFRQNIMRYEHSPFFGQYGSERNRSRQLEDGRRQRSAPFKHSSPSGSANKHNVQRGGWVISAVSVNANITAVREVFSAQDSHAAWAKGDADSFSSYSGGAGIVRATWDVVRRVAKSDTGEFFGEKSRRYPEESIKKVKGVLRHMQTGRTYDYAEQKQVNYLETTSELTEKPNLGAY